MNSLALSRRGSWSGGWQQWLSGAALAFLLILSSAGAWAAPGAHGPNGEHLDAPSAAAGSASTAPRMEARSESFELVARRDDGPAPLGFGVDLRRTEQATLQHLHGVAWGLTEQAARHGGSYDGWEAELAAPAGA